MKKMDLTMKELQDKFLMLILAKLTDTEVNEEEEEEENESEEIDYDEEEEDDWFLDEEELTKAEISFGVARGRQTYANSTAYFFCSDGMAKTKMIMVNGKYRLYYTNFMEKVDQEDLDDIALILLDRKKELEFLTNEIATLENVLEADKLRGFFAKNKASE